MTLCPIAIVAGCENCLAVKFCLLKNVIGNHGKPPEPKTKQRAQQGKDARK